MPSFLEHVRRSLHRTGEDHLELNEWLDGDHVSFSKRLQRHFRVKKYSKYVQSKWGESGLKEYRNHLKDDFGSFAVIGSILRGELRKQAIRTTAGGETNR